MKNLVNLAEKNIGYGSIIGIGAETAVLCSQLGAKVVLVARRRQTTKVMMKLKVMDIVTLLLISATLMKLKVSSKV